MDSGNGAGGVVLHPLPPLTADYEDFKKDVEEIKELKNKLKTIESRALSPVVSKRGLRNASPKATSNHLNGTNHKVGGKHDENGALDPKQQEEIELQRLKEQYKRLMTPNEGLRKAAAMHMVGTPPGRPHSGRKLPPLQRPASFSASSAVMTPTKPLPVAAMAAPSSPLTPGGELVLPPHPGAGLVAADGERTFELNDIVVPTKSQPQQHQPFQAAQPVVNGYNGYGYSHVQAVASVGDLRALKALASCIPKGPNVLSAARALGCSGLFDHLMPAGTPVTTPHSLQGSSPSSPVTKINKIREHSQQTANGFQDTFPPLPNTSFSSLHNFNITTTMPTFDGLNGLLQISNSNSRGIIAITNVITKLNLMADPADKLMVGASALNLHAHLRKQTTGTPTTQGAQQGAGQPDFHTALHQRLAVAAPETLQHNTAEQGEQQNTDQDEKHHNNTYPLTTTDDNPPINRNNQFTSVRGLLGISQPTNRQFRGLHCLHQAVRNNNNNNTSPNTKSFSHPYFNQSSISFNYDTTLQDDQYPMITTMPQPTRGRGSAWKVLQKAVSRYCEGQSISCQPSLLYVCMKDSSFAHPNESMIVHDYDAQPHLLPVCNEEEEQEHQQQRHALPHRTHNDISKMKEHIAMILTIHSTPNLKLIQKLVSDQLATASSPPSGSTSTNPPHSTKPPRPMQQQESGGSLTNLHRILLIQPTPNLELLSTCL